jgi:hypothetical protein
MGAACHRRGSQTVRPGNARKCLPSIFQTGNACRIVGWSDNDEIVVHHVAAIDAEAVRDKPVLSGTIMNQQGIGVASPAQRESLAGADRDHVNLQTRCGSKYRKNMVE